MSGEIKSIRAKNGRVMWFRDGKLISKHDAVASLKKGKALDEKPRAKSTRAKSPAPARAKKAPARAKKAPARAKSPAPVRAKKAPAPAPAPARTTRSRTPSKAAVRPAPPRSAPGPQPSGRGRSSSISKSSANVAASTRGPSDIVLNHPLFGAIGVLRNKTHLHLAPKFKDLYNRKVVEVPLDPRNMPALSHVEAYISSFLFPYCASNYANPRLSREKRMHHALFYCAFGVSVALMYRQLPDVPQIDIDPETAILYLQHGEKLANYCKVLFRFGGGLVVPA